jgi:3-hydroxybutyryl-CoA dehydrogenase
MKVWQAYEDDVIQAHKTNDLSDSQPTKGNIAGGLTTIEEKALGNIQKIGRKCMIDGVLDKHEEPTGPGLWFIDSSSAAAEMVTLCAAAGYTTVVREVDDITLNKGLGRITKFLDDGVAKGKVTGGARETTLGHLSGTTTFDGLKDCDLVIEAIIENVDDKRQTYRALETIVKAHTIFLSNTSSLCITELAAASSRPDRFGGLHFFNPVPLMKLVEVIAGLLTAPAIEQRLVDFGAALGHTPVRARDTPGFIVNRVARPYYGEALRMLQEQATTPATLDAVMRECGGFKMGPCELMDLIGHDVNFAVTKSVYEGFFDDPRYKPSLVQKDLVDAGWLGRKSGRGFFDHREGAAAATPEDVGSRASVPSTVRIEGDLGPAALLGSMLLRQDETEVARRDGAGLLRVDGFAVALSDGRTATERSVALGEPVVLFDLALDYAACSRVLLAPAAQASDLHLAKAIGLFVLLRKKVSLAADVPGLAVTRTVAMLVNEAADAVQQGIASADDVDAAMQKGVNYPIGPMAWGRQTGFGHITTVLRHLAQTYGEDRYRTSPWLQRAVHATQALGASRG